MDAVARFLTDLNATITGTAAVVQPQVVVEDASPDEVWFIGDGAQYVMEVEDQDGSIQEVPLDPSRPESRLLVAMSSSKTFAPTPYSKRYSITEVKAYKERKQQARIDRELGTKAAEIARDRNIDKEKMNAMLATEVQRVEHAITLARKQSEEASVTAETEIAKQLDEKAQDLADSINQAIRGLQFGDINAQHLQFINEDLSNIKQSLLKITDENQLVNEINHARQLLSKHNERRANPVSSHSVQAGDIELF